MRGISSLSRTIVGFAAVVACVGYVLDRDLARRQQTASSGSMPAGGFFQPSQFQDPSFQSSGSGSPSNSTSSLTFNPGSSQFMPSFLDPSKFTSFGQQQPGSSSQNGSSSSGGSSGGGMFAPNMFMNPSAGNGSQNKTGNFNIFDPSMFLMG